MASRYCPFIESAEAIHVNAAQTGGGGVAYVYSLY